MLAAAAVFLASGCQDRTELTVSGPEYTIPGIGARLPNHYHLWWRDDVLYGTGIAYWPMIWADNPPNISQGILDHVVECDYGDRFIVAKVGAKDRAPVPDDPSQRYAEFDYWILDTKERQRHGPFDIEKFQEERERLRVPQALKLRNAREFQQHANPLPPR